MLNKKTVWTPQEILKEMERRTDFGKEHLEIWRKGLEALGLEMATDNEVIEHFKKATGISRFLSLGKEEVLIVALDLPTLLAQRPDWDTATRWGSWWVFELFNRVASAKGYPIIDIYKEQATRPNFLQNMPKAAYASLLGHGNEEVFAGYQNEYILWFGDEQSGKVMQGKAANFLSCLVGAKLLPWLIDQGMEMAHGYFVTYYFVINRNAFPNSYAKWFFNAHFTFDKAILEGKTAGEAHQLTYDKYSEYFRSDEVPWVCKVYLLHDRDGMQLFGNQNWKLTEEEQPPSKWAPSVAFITLEVISSKRDTLVIPEREVYKAYPGETIYIKGKVVDKENQEYGVPYPHIRLVYEDKILGETVGDNNGNFEIPLKVDFEPGQYKLVLNFTGETGKA